MNYLTIKNDRLRRRKARTLTFLIFTALLAGFAYSSGLLGDLPALYEQLFGPEVVDAAPVAKA